MIIDCHGHYTTTPQKMKDWRAAQLAAVESGPFKASRAMLEISDDDMREGIEQNQIKLQQERGSDLTIFSPQAV
ncbi:MAG: amidohydrolase, partial [Proteobacteria bacterium]|nr:amidohydrolase [Pseudomonadota bacterium]